MSGFLRRQGQFLLQKDIHAFLMAAVLAFIPFAAWLSLAIMALVTLRKGWHSGLKVLIVGVSASIISARLTGTFPYVVQITLITYAAAFLAAGILRTSAGWQRVVTGLVVMMLAVMVLVQLLAPQYITDELRFFLSILGRMKQGEFISAILNKQDTETMQLFANYLLGIKGLSTVVSVLSSVMLARYVQSLIFYPEGFKQELSVFRVSQPLVLLLLTGMIAAYYYSSGIAVSCLPLLVFCTAAAGICLCLALLKKRKSLSALLLIIVPLIILPYIMLPVFMIFGALDSLFDFRMRLSFRHANK